jgi:predicted acyltransferase
MKTMRINSIDVFRGLSVFLMIFLNRLSDFSGTPDYLLHAEAGSLTIVDLVAPFFLFIVGICMYLSFSKRKDLGKGALAKYFLKRGLLIIVLGLVLDMMYDMVFLNWGILEAIGLSIIFTFIFIGFSSRQRIAISLLLVVAYSLLSQFPFFVEMIEALPHGSVPGVISWSIITLLGTVVGEKIVSVVSLKDKKAFSLYLVKFGIPLCIIGYLASFIISFDKSLVSSSYTLFSAGSSALFFAIFYFLVELKNVEFKILKDLGVNALFAFIYQYLTSFIMKSSQFGELIEFPFSILPSVGFVAVCWIIIKILNQKNIYLKL